MNTQKIFALLWRINAIVILIVGLLGIAGLVMVLVLIYEESLEDRRVPDVLTVGDGAESRTWLGSFSAVAGSVVLRAELNIEQEYEIASGSKESYSTQNYLFFDTSTDSSYWLLPSFKGIILSTTDVTDEEDRAAESAVKAVVYEIVEGDSNADGQLTGSDVRQIAISDAAGTRFTRALNDVETLNGVHLLPGAGATQMLIMYTSAGATRAARIDVASGGVLRDVPLKPLTEAPAPPPR
jgi:hypothetical protein